MLVDGDTFRVVGHRIPPSRIGGLVAPSGHGSSLNNATVAILHLANMSDNLVREIIPVVPVAIAGASRVNIALARPGR